jgi:hypothetical protein
VPNPFILFQEAQRESIKQIYGIDQLQQVSVIAGKIWEGMKDAEKEVYVLRSNELRMLKVAEMLGTSKPSASVSVNPSTTTFSTLEDLNVPIISERGDAKDKSQVIRRISTTNLNQFNAPNFVSGWTPTSAEFKPEFELMLYLAKNSEQSYDDRQFEPQPSWFDLS